MNYNYAGYHYKVHNWLNNSIRCSLSSTRSILENVSAHPKSFDEWLFRAQCVDDRFSRNPQRSPFLCRRRQWFQCEVYVENVPGRRDSGVDSMFKVMQPAFAAGSRITSPTESGQNMAHLSVLSSKSRPFWIHHFVPKTSSSWYSVCVELVLLFIVSALNKWAIVTQPGIQEIFSLNSISYSRI